MSLNRCKNVFTLGSFQLPPVTQQNLKMKLKQRQRLDPFARDPFKIQSYNFRYADRPIFSIPDFQQRSNNYRSGTECQTYFYNNDFPCTTNAQKSALYNCSSNLTKFQEHRRKKFLQEPSATTNCGIKSSFSTLNNNNGRSTNSKTYNSKILNLYYGGSGSQQNCTQDLKSNGANLTSSTNNFDRPQNLSHSSMTNATQKESNNCFKSPLLASPTQHQSLASTSRLESVNRHRSLSSGCEININIKGLEMESATDNVTINIETDSMSKNLDIPKNNRVPSSAQSIHKLKDLKSSKSFVIDKTLSKFSLEPQNKESFRRPLISASPQNKESFRRPKESLFERKNTFQSLHAQEQKCLRDKQRERVQALTSVYCPQSVQSSNTKFKTPIKKSSDRIPSMMPFRSKSDIGTIKNLPPTKNSFLQRSQVKDNLNIVVKPSAASKLSNDVNNFSTNSIANEKKILNSSLLASKKSFLKKFNASRNSSRSNFAENQMVSSLSSLPSSDRRTDPKHQNNTKLPVNVNINVFADKFKILKE